jgi:hypothetical protein
MCSKPAEQWIPRRRRFRGSPSVPAEDEIQVGVPFAGNVLAFRAILGYLSSAIARVDVV